MNDEQRLRILIADDSEDQAQITAELISLSLPCEIETVYDGQAALDRALAWQPDAVVLDVYMPELDGIEVARRLRQHAAGTPGYAMPYCIAVTGDPGAGSRLQALDKQFDRVFAKPLDVDQLIAALARLGRDDIATAPAAQPFNLGELFTRAARQVLPVAQHLSFSFDYRGPGVVVVGEPVEVHCGLHRLLLAAVDMLADGFVLFTAETVLRDSGGCSTLVQAAGTGTLRPALQMAEVLDRLSLLPPPADVPADAVPGEATVREGVQTAIGRCPNTGATVRFTLDPHEGILLRAELRFAQATPDDSAQAADATGARAWLIDSDEVPAAWLHRRLQRMGWRVNRFANCAEAERYAAEPDARPPSLLVVVEAPLMRPAAVLSLQRALPAATQCILAVMAGSPTLGAPEAYGSFEVRVYPFSPLELAEFAARAHPDQPTRTGALLTGAMELADRPLVLLVDDNEINRLVGRALVEALGYEVVTANDGLDAIGQCRIQRPQIVLMDLDMPVLKGVDATLRLRELQRNGEIPPLAIIAATADATDDARLACHRAGMDGFMTKPLDIADLRAQLRRFTASRV